MKFRHNQICTKDDEVIVGNNYDYKEDSYIAEVEVLEMSSDDKGIGFKLKVIKQNYELGEEIFDVWAASGLYAYSGMWRLYDKGRYTYQLDL